MNIYVLVWLCGTCVVMLTAFAALGAGARPFEWVDDVSDAAGAALITVFCAPAWPFSAPAYGAYRFGEFLRDRHTARKRAKDAPDIPRAKAVRR